MISSVLIYPVKDDNLKVKPKKVNDANAIRLTKQDGT